MGKKDCCCAPGCSHRRHKGATCSFFRFPSDQSRRNQWVSKIFRVKPWQPIETSRLCSCHFEELRDPNSRKTWEGVPNIFAHCCTPSKPARKALIEIQSPAVKVKETKTAVKQKTSLIDGLGIELSERPVTQHSDGQRLDTPDQVDETIILPDPLSTIAGVVTNTDGAQIDQMVSVSVNEIVALGVNHSECSHVTQHSDAQRLNTSDEVDETIILPDPLSTIAGVVTNTDGAQIDQMISVSINETHQLHDHGYVHPIVDQPTDHDYYITTIDENSFKFVDDHPDLADFIKRTEMFKADSVQLESLKLKGQVIIVENVMKNEKLFTYYTGLNVSIFSALLEYLQPKAKSMKYPYGSRTVSMQHYLDVGKKAPGERKKPGRPRALTLKEELFFTLAKLKLGLQEEDIAVRAGISQSSFSSIFTAWVTLLSHELEMICAMPPTTELDSTAQAKCFEEFSNIRIIIDCTELFSEKPSSVGVHKQFHSNYKHHSTVKFLVGMNTGGAIIYVSDMFGGRTSDKFITNSSEDLVNKLNSGEKVMADRGFTIQDDLPAGVKLVIPAFKHKDKSQFTKPELNENKKISEARVHIERAIRRIKQFQILKLEVKLAQVDVYCNIFKACGYLVNFQDPFLKLE